MKIFTIAATLFAATLFACGDLHSGVDLDTADTEVSQAAKGGNGGGGGGGPGGDGPTACELCALDTLDCESGCHTDCRWAQRQGQPCEPALSDCFDTCESTYLTCLDANGC